MNSYKVMWVIDIDADNHVDAARQALAIQRDPNSIATMFYVQRQIDRPPFLAGAERTVKVDLAPREA